MMTSFQQIKYGSIISYSLIILNILLGLLYTPWILKEIGSSDYGLYTLASSLISLFLIDFGMSSAVTRFVSIYRAQEQLQKINQFLTLVVKLYLIIMAIISILLIIVYFNIDILYSNLTVQEISVFKGVYIITAVCVIVCFPVNICNGILNAFEEYIFLKGTDVLNKIGVVIVTIIALINHGDVFALILINGIFNILTFILKIGIIYKTTEIKLDFHYKNYKEMSGIFSFSLWTTVTSISQQMIFNIMPSILAMVVNTMAITLYGFANVIEGYISTITGAVNGLFLPKISRTVVNDSNSTNIISLMIQVGRINQSIVILLLVGLITLGKEFVNIWVGNEYYQLYYCILLLAIPYFVSASEQIADNTIVVLNKIKYSALINVITGILNLVLAYFIAPQYGIIGVCFITGLIFWIRIIFLNIVYYYILKINIWYFFKSCQIKLLPATIIIFILAYGISLLSLWNATTFECWLSFIIKVLLIVLEYCIVMWMVGWNRFEKNLILSFIRPGKKE